MTYQPPYDLDPPGNDEVDGRAEYFRDVDPFPLLPPALLSSEHVADYVRVTGMLHPFHPSQGRLKPASYEARPGKFIRWDDEGRKIIQDIKPGETYELPENSITFVQIESKIRLPNYIALRFNLRIKHVHRGLLLGTGPLVDPGFKGDLLIPLHNLTMKPYVVKGEEGIIWIEFTKTTHNSEKWLPQRGQFQAIEQHKTDVSPEVYFERANANNPIQSSIPYYIKDANQKANAAAASAKKAARTNLFFASLGFFAILGMILAAANFAIGVVKDTTQSSKDANQALTDGRRLSGENAELRRTLEDTRQQLQELKTNVETLRQRVDTRPPN
jgi:deoxycytidine triphosphate deaminase